ncbi:MAG: DMT family transporter [Candidatus Puniceispirillaceae bacterium]
MSPRDYLLYACVIFGWSTSWLPLKGQVGFVAPEVSVLWRFIIAAALCFLIARLQGLKLAFPARLHLRFAALGLMLFSTNFTLFYYASPHLASGLLAVVFSTASLLNILMLACLSRSAPPPRQLLASVIGLGGIVLIFLPELRLSAAALPALLLCVAGTLFFCAGNLVSALLQKQNVPVMSANSWGMVYGCGVLSLYALVLGNPFIIDGGPAYLTGLVWLAVFSSVVAFACYLTLVGRIGAGRAGYATVIFPVFALLISTVFEGYSWTVLSAAGIGLVLAGNLLMLRSR